MARRVPARRLVGSLWLAAAFGGLSHPLAAQAPARWNAPEALALARRGVERRLAAQADSSLRSYRTRAHGFVFFLAQVGEGLREPPRLVKADELDVEVYWRAPNLSKQIILGWRTGAFLPYGINYHRDHLGIVTNNFGNLIRIGEGDEVRDVVHPLSPAGLDLYQFALDDSTMVQSGAGQLKVYLLRARPRDFDQPRVVGTLYLDATTAEVVRFRFSFTPAAYLDKDLEDISIALENSLWDQRYWLPRRQEIEIRRRTTWLDFPARGIIRGRWEIKDYEFNVPFPEELANAPPIGGLRRARPDDSTWAQPLDQAVAGVATPATEEDVNGVRDEVERIAGARVLTGLPPNRLAARSVSDIVRVNRVQGLAFGAGAAFAVARRQLEIRPHIGFGTSDHRVTGGLTLGFGPPGTRLTLTGERQIRDFSDVPIVAPLVNSLSAQETGRDYGDYVRLDRAAAGLRYGPSNRTLVAVEAGVEHTRSVTVEATPARGHYRPNPPLGAGTYGVGRLRLELAGAGFGATRELQGAFSLEGGAGDTDYLRAMVDGTWRAQFGDTELLTRAVAGWGTEGTPAWRNFAIGGRGTLVGEPFRAWGGRRMALAQAEWRFQVPVPAISFGSFASTGKRMTVAPFVAAGWADRPAAGAPWVASDGIRPVAGLALEWFMRLIRVEAGVGLRTGEVGVTIDVGRAWWGVL